MKRKRKISAIERRAMRRHRDIVVALEHVAVGLELIACLLEGDDPDPGYEVLEPEVKLRVVK
jgi:hypothetical protein